MISFALSFLTAFFIGAIPTAYLFVRRFKHADIRDFGSGNVGATNAARVLGKKWGVLIFAIDFLKGFFPALLLSQLAAPFTGVPFVAFSTAELSQFIGLGAIFGHIFSPFLKGKGGKGIATGAGVICAGYPGIFVLLLLVWILLMVLSHRTVSISSIGAVIAFVVFTILFLYPLRIVCFALGLLALVIWTHRSNISRFLQGREIHSY